jgi:hypothetical protein
MHLMSTGMMLPLACRGGDGTFGPIMGSAGVSEWVQWSNGM